MYCVYWDGEHECRSKVVTDLKEALTLAEEKRKAGFRFVTMVSENPNSVGKPGVDVTGPDYNWTKRRTTELRFPK